MIDIPGRSLDVAALPEPPEGMEIARVDVIVRLRKEGLTGSDCHSRARRARE